MKATNAVSANISGGNGSPVVVKDGEINRIAVVQVSERKSVSKRLREIYSRMKYGDPEAVRSSALLLLNAIINDQIVGEAIDRQETIVITSSAFGSVPTAAYAIMKDLSSLLRGRGVDVIELKIDRAGDFGTTSYGSMSVDDRNKRMKSRKITISDEATDMISGKVCLVIDDVNVTGSHEKTLHNLLSQTQAKSLFFCYLLAFTSAFASKEPYVEDFFNHAFVKSVSDLRAFYKTPNSSDKKLRINARTIKFILETEDACAGDSVQKSTQLRKFLLGLDDWILIDLYKAAVSADGYYRNPKFTDGFHILSDVIVAKRAMKIQKVYDDSNVTVLGSVAIDDKGNLFDMTTGQDLNHLGKRYSLMKFGSYCDIKWFGDKMADCFIARLENPEDSLLKVFEGIREAGEHIVMLSPGSRNVESSQNFIYEVAIKKINVWLALRGLPTIIMVKLSRFSSGTANYAQLSVEDRIREKRGNNTTKSVLPAEEFFQAGVHVLFADDARITGASADRVEKTCLDRGARSFFSMYCVVVDPLSTISNPAIEQFLNTFLVKGKLDDNIVHILSQDEFRPVQRLLRLILNKSNRPNLASFLRERVGDKAAIKIYCAALGNGYLSDKRYADSLLILQSDLIKRGLVSANGIMM